MRSAWQRLRSRRGLAPAAGVLAALAVAGVAVALVSGSDDDPAAGSRGEPGSDVATVRGTPRPAAPAAPTAEPAKPQRRTRRTKRPRREFRATPADVRDVVEDRLGPTGTSEPRVRGVRCGRGRCVVRYVASHRGRGKILEDQVKIMRALFADPKLREVKLLVHHQKFGRHKDEALPIFEITCDRAGYRRLARRGDESRCKTVMRTGQDREAPHAKDGRPGGRGGPPAGRGGGPPEQR